MKAVRQRDEVTPKFLLPRFSLRASSQSVCFLTLERCHGNMRLTAGEAGGASTSTLDSSGLTSLSF